MNRETTTPSRSTRTKTAAPKVIRRKLLSENLSRPSARERFIGALWATLELCNAVAVIFGLFGLMGPGNAPLVDASPPPVR